MNLPGFESPESYLKRSRRALIVSNHALQKRGKTHLGLTMPRPLAVISVDIGLRELVNKLDNQKDLFIAEFYPDDAGNKADYERLWDKIEHCYYTVLKQGVRSLFVDTGTEFWEILRMARFGKLTQVMPNHYGPVNKEFTDLVRAAYKYGTNVMLSHKLKKEFGPSKKGEGDSWTGKYEHAGFKDIPFLADVVLEQDRKTYADEHGNPTVTEFTAQILDCRANPSVIGQMLAGPEMLNFPFLASMVFPDTTEEDWK